MASYTKRSGETLKHFCENLNRRRFMKIFLETPTEKSKNFGKKMLAK